MRSQLEKIVSDGRFAASKRYPYLLRYIVEQTLAGNEDDLKERTLGVEVFHRPPDYDTNADPVVRLCAAEVRKRLAQYYQSPAHGGELRIDLNPGSYVPVFSQPAPDAPIVEAIPPEAIPPDAPSKAEQVSQPRRNEKNLLAGGFDSFWRDHRRDIGPGRSVLETLRETKVRSRRSLVSVAHQQQADLVLCGRNRNQLFAPHDSPLTQLQSGADDDSFLQAFADKNDFVPFSDVQVLSRFVSLIGAHGHDFRLQNSRTTISSQLREGPVVLIGALNNEWTLNRTSSLRFHLEGPEGPDQVYWIADTQHPESRAWQVRAQAPRSRVVKDYAIAARFTDESTGQVVLVAAGIAGSGTRAAGEFLTDEASLKQLVDGASVDWGRTNFEVVLSSQVVNGMQGKPKVEAKAFW